MTAPLGLGMVGCGGFGAFTLAVYTSMPDVRVFAVTDVDAAAREALGLQTRDIPPARRGQSAPLSRVYLLTRDPSLDPYHPVIADLSSTALFERMLAHAHPFDLGGVERPRRMIERLMSIAGQVRGCDLRFAPSLAALTALVDTVVQHLETR